MISLASLIIACFAITGYISFRNMSGNSTTLTLDTGDPGTFDSSKDYRICLLILSY